MISIIGMGPGSTDYMTPIGLKAISAADVIIGSARWLALFADNPAEKLDLHPIDGLIAKLKADGNNQRIAVLVSGDPGLYSLLQVINREAPAFRVEVIPGISAPQVLFARLRLDWSDVDFISLHGRSMEKLKSFLGRGARLCVFTDAANTPMNIGRSLLAEGHTGKAVVGADLTGDDERLAEMTLEELADYQAGPLSIVYLEIN